jgi:peptidoglycan/xylan/chitin deacetylase (PgdA/CDA1 family)
MTYLYKAGYQCLRLGEALRCLQEGLPQPKRSFVLTFDDGYRDLYTTVWPILERFGFTATVFLVAGRAGCWSDWEGQSGPAAAPLLSWAEARELANLGLTFGCHTLTHPRLTDLDDRQARREIQESKLIIEDRLAVKVDAFSYPHHDSDARIMQIVAESGYNAACGGQRGGWEIFNLWRADCLRDEKRLSFALKADGRYYPRIWQLIWLCERTHVGRTLFHKVRTLKRLRSMSKNGAGSG